MLKLKRPKKLPTFSGIYVFRGVNDKALYVGKAANLKTRLSFYFGKDAQRQPKIVKLLAEASSLKLIKTDSAIEALIKETALIKRLRPKYNILMRDDKNYLFVALTDEDFPRLILTHQPKALGGIKKALGPFTDVKALKMTLKILRRAFPYCTCGPAKLHKRLCLNAELGKCPGPCCAKKLDISSKGGSASGGKNEAPRSRAAGYSAKENKKLKGARTEYQRNIKAIAAILSGKKISELISKKKSEIRTASQALEYERAAHLRDQVFALEQILRHKSVLRLPLDLAGTWGALEEKLREVSHAAKRIERVEGYDISNISGTSATGAMAVFVKGTPYKNEYRKFKIRSVKGANDVAMMAEVIIRRFRHQEWPFPELVVLDGGKPQLNAILAELTTNNPTRPSLRALGQQLTTVVVALAKRDEELYVAGRKYPIQLKKQPREVLHFFQRVRDEAHRFAGIYHHKLRAKTYAEE